MKLQTLSNINDKIRLSVVLNFKRLTRVKVLKSQKLKIQDGALLDFCICYHGNSGY